VVGALASGTQVRGSNPAEAVGFFGWTNPQRAFLLRGSKSRRSQVAALRHVKIPYNYGGSHNCKLNLLGHLSPIVLPFSARGLARHLCAARAWRVQVRPKEGWYIQSAYRLQCPRWGKPTGPTVKEEEEKGGNPLQYEKTFRVFYKLEVKYRQNWHFCYGGGGFTRQITVLSTDWSILTLKCEVKVKVTFTLEQDRKGQRRNRNINE
jgi:hypothetical protein